jgi:hypothetical protein
MDSCVGLFGKLFGHNYKPVYDEKSEPNPYFHIKNYYGNLAEIIKVS